MRRTANNSTERIVLYLSGEFSVPVSVLFFRYYADAVRVEWIRTVPREQAVKEKGLFANQNSACKLRNSFTLERLTERFALDS